MALETEKLHFVQWIRVLLTSLVVGLHGAQPYGPTGGAWAVSDPANSDWLFIFLSINAAFLMGFFFFIAAYFIEASYDRKGPGAFLKGRLVRLGIPLAFAALVFLPVWNWLEAPTPIGFASFVMRESIGALKFDLDHLWFVFHLLIYSGLYVLLRALVGPRKDRPGPKPPGHGAIFAYLLVLGLATAAVRTEWPQDRWVMIFGVIPSEIGHLPQYVSLFVIGILAGRGRWFTEIPRRTCYTWFWIGAVLYAAAIPLVAIEDDLPAWLPIMRIWAVMEGFVCIAMIMGITGLFRSRLSAPGPWLGRLGPQVYGVY
ncbi:MAG: acyltransferase family protein, partial [Alphaproteobacteria bacterium]|nr:acyltransferase family protein [Alphaproteobacteria bacterium]